MTWPIALVLVMFVMPLRALLAALARLRTDME
jgi:hypothetical protein